MVGVELAQRTSTEDACHALQQVIAQAQAEIGARGASLVTRRGEVAQEALQVRGSLFETGNTMEVLYTNAKAEFINSQGVTGEMCEHQKKARDALGTQVGRAIGAKWDALELRRAAERVSDRRALAGEAAARAAAERQAGAGPMPRT